MASGKGTTQRNYHFMEPGHIKCICDGCFGKIRQLFKRSDVDTPPQLNSLIEHSTRINSSVMYSDSYGVGTNFQWYGWDSHFNSVFKPLLVFGNITICGLPMRTLLMFMPLPAVGLTEERLKYLREQERGLL